MSIALAGLAIFQVQHLRELLSIRQKQFDSNVMQSLHEAASLLENRESAQLINNVLSIEADSVLNATSLLHDSIKLLLEAIHSPQIKINIPKHNFKYHFKHDSLGFFQHFEYSEQLEKEREQASEAKRHAGETAIELKVEALKDRLSKKEKQISIVMKKMEQEALFPRENIRSRLDAKEIEKTLTASLQNRGVKIPYSYAIVNGENDSILISNDSNAISKTKEPVYSTQLFPNDIIPENNFLKVWFPQKSMFLFSLSDFNLFSSFIFILMVMVCFAYTLMTLIKQKKLSDMKSDFINNMTHELKTPIATISVAADALRDTAPVANEAQVKYYTGIIRQENERMNAQVERVLQLARLDKKEMQLNKESVNIHDLIHNAAAIFRMQVEKSNGTLKEELTAEHPVIQADPLHLSNVIHNLLDNARKYSLQNPEIKIKTWNEGEGIVISVSDKGIGMSKETVKKIFDKFYRASRGNIHDVKGFGIGLSYVKEIVELHGGRIMVESQPDAGSTFIVFLPYE